MRFKTVLNHGSELLESWMNLAVMIMGMIMIVSRMMMMCECVQVEVSAWMNQFQPSGPQSVIGPPLGTLPYTLTPLVMNFCRGRTTHPL